VKAKCPMTLVPNCNSYPPEVLLPAGGNMTPAELILAGSAAWTGPIDVRFLPAYQDALLCGGTLPQLERSGRYPQDRDVDSYRPSARYYHSTSHSLDITLAGHLFDILDGFRCLFLRSTSDIYLGIVFQEVLSSEFPEPRLYRISSQHGHRY
jgi:hypothetical protein